MVGLDGSTCSGHAGQASFELARSLGSSLVACHVYAAQMHRARFSEMEIGLPDRYQEQSKLEHLRDTHEDIISGGMKVISDAYLADFVAKASEAHVKVDTETPEGKNYVRFLDVLRKSRAGLTVIGAEGQGKVDEATLGSFAERVLLLSGEGDVLIMRRGWSLKGRPIVVGIDGSDQSYDALRKAVGLAARFGGSVKAVAVYDPFFHSGVFSSISSALTKEQAGKFNFAAQERLHDEIIDDGLRSLYDKRLDKGLELVGRTEVKVDKEILTGKVFSQLSHYSSALNAGLIVVGRFGMHRESPSLIGSTTHALARACSTNLLVVGSTRDSSVAVSQGNFLQRDAPAVTPTEAPPPARLDSDSHGAETVILKKVKRFAPAFHEHIVRARIVGQEVQVGTRFMVFDIVETTPPGKVLVTPSTKLEFI